VDAIFGPHFAPSFLRGASRRITVVSTLARDKVDIFKEVVKHCRDR